MNEKEIKKQIVKNNNRQMKAITMFGVIPIILGIITYPILIYIGLIISIVIFIVTNKKENSLLKELKNIGGTLQ